MNVVDYYPAFHGNAIKRLEQNDYQLADHVFVIGETLKRYLIRELEISPEKITVLGQGVAEEPYQRSYSCPAELLSIGRPIGVWVGVLNKADQELMESAACALKAMGGSMVLIGPAGDWEQESMSRHENIYWIGPKPTNQIPAYLLHSDFGLMLYDRTKQDVYKGQNPLKLYEYLAAGLTVLSTDHDEFEFLDPPVHIVKQPHDISKTINPKTDLEAISKLGRRYVESRCWTNVVSRAECVIKSLVEANND